MNKEFCYHNGKYNLDKNNKCCKCGLPLKKGIKGVRLLLKTKRKMNKIMNFKIR